MEALPRFKQSKKRPLKGERFARGELDSYELAIDDWSG